MSQQEQFLELKKQIDHICMHFQLISSEAKDIVHTSNMPDATLQLNDVLQHTEKATSTIIESVSGIGALVTDSTLPDATKTKIASYIDHVYEACNFQDISGQRIKKVLLHISELETQLARLSDISKGKAQQKSSKDSLLNGPQLSAVAPSQQDIDNMFKSS
jgi:chemotaxis protein CheZ